MKQKPEVIQSWLDELEAKAKKLTKWEEGFVESVSEQFQTRKTISDRQEEILERIYAEKT
jgi:uncharacterized membrane-anchored protein